MSSLILSVRKSGDEKCCCFSIKTDAKAGDYIVVSKKEAFETNACDSCCGCCSSTCSPIKSTCVKLDEKSNKYVLGSDAKAGDYVCICKVSF